ncbi:2-aminobenzoate-CoA ligase (plasmid) [Rhodococcus erythropolis]|uniref:AMP-binding protein n=1 Tax=Rhodococcus erythropolis TaxID=1833 RepID=UPI00061B8936|nr:AMP-binding protein [Rhodococcus erythropolis]AKE01132.1 2-aminobenzoate-CoA ligase [Rhodococcus erythropolis]
MLSASSHIDTFCRDNLPPESQWPEFLTDLPELCYPERLNCAVELLDGTINRLGGDRPCLLGESVSWTYAELRRVVNRIAHVLVDDLGVQSGNRVMLRGFNDPWTVACWLAVVKAGGVVVTTMPLLRSGELTKLIDLTRPVVVLCDHRLRAEVDTVEPHISVLEYGSDAQGNLEMLADSKSEEFHAVDTAADDVVLLAPTSGTTGVPKATMHFHRDVLATADTFSKYLVKPKPDDVFIGSPPLAFTFGLGGLVIFPMRVGAATVLIDKPSPSALTGAIARHGATVLFTAPTAYKAMLRGQDLDLVKTLHRCVSAGEHLPAAIWQDFHDATGIKLIDGIGGTEMLHVFISASDDDIRPGSTGRAVPGFRVEIHDETGAPMPDGTPGQLAVKGPTGCRYLADARQLNYVRNGWNMTGDIYTRDADGYFWYHGRSDDMIVSSGYNIGAPEVEGVLDTHPDVRECAVVGLPDPERGMIVHASIVLKNGVADDDEKKREIQEFFKATAAPYKYPRSIEFVSSLPRTESGKLQRFRVRDGHSVVS